MSSTITQSFLARNHGGKARSQVYKCSRPHSTLLLPRSPYGLRIGAPCCLPPPSAFPGTVCAPQRWVLPHGWQLVMAARPAVNMLPCTAFQYASSCQPSNVGQHSQLRKLMVASRKEVLKISHIVEKRLGVLQVQFKDRKSVHSHSERLMVEPLPSNKLALFAQLKPHR